MVKYQGEKKIFLTPRLHGVFGKVHKKEREHIRPKRSSVAHSFLECHGSKGISLSIRRGHMAFGVLEK